MLLRTTTTLLALACLPLFAQKDNWTVDFLGSYYDQDGERSPVTGGLGTEELQSIGPVFIINYQNESPWSYQATVGLDNITSASTDGIDIDQAGTNVSSASRQDNRVFTNVGATHSGDRQTVGFNLGFSKEYDYLSINGGFNYSRAFNQKNTYLGLGFNHYQDQIDLYNIDGVNEGDADRETNDLTISLSQVLSPKAIAVFELFVSDQSGFLSTPFHELRLDDGSRVAERLPDARQRMAFKASLNYAFTNRFVLRSYLRYYDDDWGIDAQTLELEPHFKLGFGDDTWLYPILRYHTQSGSDYWGLPGSFTTNQDFYTTDWDLGEFDSQKYGLGFRTKFASRLSDYLEVRLTHYERDGGFSSTGLAIGLGWSW